MLPHLSPASVGTGAALRNLGSSSQLVAAYLAAEFGDRPRHSWTAAAVWAATSMLAMTAILAVLIFIVGAAVGAVAGFIGGFRFADWLNERRQRDRLRCQSARR